VVIGTGYCVNMRVEGSVNVFLVAVLLPRWQELPRTCWGDLKYRLPSSGGTFLFVCQRN